MRYKDPSKIYSPQDVITEVNVLFDDHDSVSIAKIKWDGKYVIGIRWNIAMREWDNPDKISGNKECLGMPVSRGYPTWFILPEEITIPNSEINVILKNFKL